MWSHTRCRPLAALVLATLVGCALGSVKKPSRLLDAALSQVHLQPGLNQGLNRNSSAPRDPIQVASVASSGEVTFVATKGAWSQAVKSSDPANASQYFSNDQTSATKKLARVASSVNQTMGSEIWDPLEHWSTFKRYHVAGVVAHIRQGLVRWASVSYMDFRCVMILSLMVYPAFLVALFLILAIVVSLCLSTRPESEIQAATSAQGGSNEASGQFSLPVLPVSSLTNRSQQVYTCWAWFCCCVPCLMVFGNPALLVGLSYPYPQEMISALSLLSSGLMFSNGVYMMIFSSFALLRMRHAMATDYSQPPDAHNTPREEKITHWVVIPQYKEDMEVVSMVLRSIGASGIARKSISVLLAMEEREVDSMKKANQLGNQYGELFQEVLATYHPPNLPNDPPGKASNMAWAFKALCSHLHEKGRDSDRVLLTVCDADSEFHQAYFEALTRHYVMTKESKRDLTIFQSPVFHLKNYHRQPMPVIVGTMFTCMQELAMLSDPNAIRFPYSTYSLSINLAKRVGGWDPEWIAEDWHMGIKCYLLTLGQSTVESVLLPTVNYTPEDLTWWTTVDARWAQAKRHALGFSDLAYYFMILPLVYGHIVTKAPHKLHRFWGMVCFGITVIVKLINVHVMIGCLTTYGLMSFVLRIVMSAALRDSRHIQDFFTRTHFCLFALMVSSFACMTCVTIIFSGAYHLMTKGAGGKMNGGGNRIEGTSYRSPFLHWLYTIIAFAVFGPVYFLGLGICTWKAAVDVLLYRNFEYEVASKPTAAMRESGT